MPPPVSVVTVTFDGYFFTRLLVEKVREYIGPREYEIIVVDRGSRDGTREWLCAQPDVRMITKRQWRKRHGHGEAAEAGVRLAKHEAIVLLDSDAHPVDPRWLEYTVDRLDDHYRLAGALFRGVHRGNTHGWYIHPYFMTFFKSDLGGNVILRKVRGHDTDTGEEATIRILDAGLGIHAYPMELCTEFAVGRPDTPSVAAGVFHAWYVTRLLKTPDSMARATNEEVTRENYLEPLQAKLRAAYGLEY